MQAQCIGSLPLTLRKVGTMVWFGGSGGCVGFVTVTALLCFGELALPVQWRLVRIQNGVEDKLREAPAGNPGIK